MSEIATTQKGKRRPRIEVAERVAFVRQSWSVHAGDRTKVHADFVDFYGATSARTIDEYVARVHREWLRDAKEDSPSERAAFLASLDADLVLYAKAKAWGAHQGARRLQARVLGLDVQTVDVRGGLTFTPGRAANENEPLTEHEMELAADALARERARLPHSFDDSTSPAIQDASTESATGESGVSANT